MNQQLKVAILSYPMLFQRKGGLQIQIIETITSLNKLGLNAKLIDPNVEKLSNYDLVHVFSPIHGNHKIVEAAKDIGLPVVISSLIRPSWNRFSGLIAKYLDRIVGKISQWNIQTTYEHINYALQSSTHIIALSDLEKSAIVIAFGISPDKITVIPNGVPLRFFNAEKEYFIKKTGIKRPFVLNVAAINSHKNQLTLVQTLQDAELDVVLVGECNEQEKYYLQKIQKYPNVHYLGGVDYDDPLLPSSYAAASVFCLPSHNEVSPLSVLESLAAGTPVVMTKNHCMDIASMKNVIIEVEPTDQEKIKLATITLISQETPAYLCKQSVEKFSWEVIADMINNVYKNVLLNFSNVTS